MDIIKSEVELPGGSQGVFNAFVLLFIALIGFIIIGPLIGFIIGIPFYSQDLTSLQNTLADPASSPDGKRLLYFLQAGSTLGMVIVPLIYVKAKMHIPIKAFFANPLSIIGLGLAGIITFTFMGFNSLIIEWNANLNLPEFMSGFEQWAQEKEQMAAELTGFLATFDSNAQFIVALFIMAVFPAIAEEFVFRGLVQNRLSKGMGNAHWAIWISAALFSGIHMQFFGFFPRMFLGALFGYLYLWSGNLLIPIFAHFVNNAFTLCMIYFYSEEIVAYDIQNSDPPELPAVLLFTIITSGLIFYFRKHYQTINSRDGSMAKGV